MTQAFFADRAADYVDDLLCPAALARLGLVEPAAAWRLVEKARRQKGRMSGEREEMALVGVITLQLLGHFYLERFGHRAPRGTASVG